MFHCHYMSIMAIFYPGIQLRIPHSMYSLSLLKIPSSNFSQLFLVFLNLKRSEQHWSGVLQNTLHPESSLCFLMDQTGICIWLGENITEVKFPSHSFLSGAHDYQYDKFLHCKVIVLFSPFFVNNLINQPSVKSR